MQCPVYKTNRCLFKSIFNPQFNSSIFKLSLEVISESYQKDCEGDIALCSFVQRTKQEPEFKEPEVQKVEEPEPVEVEPVVENKSTKVSIHQVANPYNVKADVLVFPANIILNIDDPLLNRMSGGIIQSECDSFKKPIKMGTVYITSNGNERTQVKPKKIYHAVVAGESRLVNESDIKSATRKALRLADNDNARNVVIVPCDCGTHDVNDTARVQLSAVKTFLQTEKECKIKNIFFVMEDKESFDIYEEYYNRIFG
jgi:O-acetyl-ADP-ribose deacetylase (regulator of RNase III)